MIASRIGLPQWNQRGGIAGLMLMLGTVISLMLLLADVFVGNWHGIASFHPSSFLILLLLFPSIGIISSKNFGKRIHYIIIACFVYLMICGIFTAIVSLRPPVSTLPIILDVLVQTWPYSKLPICFLIAIAFHLCGLGSWLSRVLFLFAVIFVVGYVYAELRKGHSSPVWFHNAYFAALSIIVAMTLFGKILRGLLSTKNMIIYSVVASGFALSPLYGALRGASMILVVCIGLMVVTNSSGIPLRAIASLALCFLLVLSPLWNKVAPTFREHNPYSYQNPIDVVRGFSTKANTAQERLGWWDQAIRNFVQSPFVGSVFAYNTGGELGVPTTSPCLHNYFASVLMDGGLLLFLPLVYILMKGLSAILRLWKTNKKDAGICLVWVYIVLMTYFTNVYAHVDYSSTPLNLILGSAIARALIENGLINQQKRYSQEPFAR